MGKLLDWLTELRKTGYVLRFNSQTEERKALGKGQGAFMPSECAVLPTAMYSPTPFSRSLQSVVLFLFLNKWRLLWTDICAFLHVSFLQQGVQSFPVSFLSPQRNIRTLFRFPGDINDAGQPSQHSVPLGDPSQCY